MQTLLTFLSGRKTYLIAVSALLYALGIHFGWWAHYPDLDLALGGAGAISIRLAIAKLCAAVANDPAMRVLIALGLILIAFGFGACAGQQFGGSATDSRGNVYSGSVKLGPHSPLSGFVK